MSNGSPTPNPLLPAFTFAVWTGCAVVGGLGLVLGYARVTLPAAEPDPISTAPIPVETPAEKPVEKELVLTPEAPQPAHEDPAPAAADVAPPPPPAPPPVAPPEAPAFTAVAAPEAPVAFKVAVDGPTRVVPHELAAPGRETGSQKGVTGGKGTAPEGVPGGTGTGPGVPGGTGAAPVQAKELDFGHGEGAQAKPDYPREAQRRRQEGTVRIRLEVNEAGAVTQAEVAEACPFPLLNQAALSTVKKSWKFPAGAKRLYVVAIKFVLN